MNLFFQLISSLGAGTLAAFTPCVIVLFPVILYTYFNKEKKLWFRLSIFSVSFVVSYILFGYLLATLVTSAIKNGVLISIAIIFIILGFMQIFKVTRNLNVKFTNNDILLGIVFAIVTSTNPCTLPFFGVIIGQNLAYSIILNLAMFAIGILIPPIVLLIATDSLFYTLKRKISRLSNAIELPLNILLILMGIYILIKVSKIGYSDLFIISIVLFFLLFFFMWSFYLLTTKKDLLRIENILLIVGSALLIFVIFYHCSNTISQTPVPSQDSINGISNHNILKTTDLLINSKNHTFSLGTKKQQTCSYTEISHCPYCFRCINLFLISSGIIFFATFLDYHYRFKHKKRKHKKDKSKEPNHNETQNKKSN